MISKEELALNYLHFSNIVWWRVSKYFSRVATSALTRSPYSRRTSTAAAAPRTRTVRRPCQQRQLQGRQNRQKQQLHCAGFALVLCGHLPFCESCAMRVWYLGGGCLVCRAETTMVMHISSVKSEDVSTSGPAAAVQHCLVWISLDTYDMWLYLVQYSLLRCVY